ncbi:MAG: trigger factor [Vicinamibacteria bacterium]|nr:trigger factor [Vicinamibacteria bacterium]
MKVEYLDETAVRKTLDFEIPDEGFDREIDQRAREYARRLRLPGFRPGKVPLDVVKKRFRREILDEAAESIIRRVVPKEIGDRGFKPIGSPQVSDIRAEEHRPLRFRATFEILPTFELPDYRGLPVLCRQPRIADEDVDREIEKLRDRAASFEPIEDRGVDRGDFVLLHLTWSIEGGQPHREENALIQVDDPANHPDLTAALLGMNAGDSKRVVVQYSAEHDKPDMAGRKVEYAFSLKAIKRRRLPPIDDEFARDIGHDDLDGLRASVSARLLNEDRQRVDHEIEQSLIAALVERGGFDLPDALVEAHMDVRTENAARTLAIGGVDPRQSGVDWRAYRETQRDAAVKSAKADIMLDAIARKESIDVLPGEVDAELTRIANHANSPKETLRRRMQASGDLAKLVSHLRRSKTLDLLKANARLTTD